MRRTKTRICCLLILLCMFLPMGRVVALSAQSDKIQELAFDVVFVIDSSGSMRHSDPDRIAVEAAKLFTDMCEYSSSRVGYVAYTEKLYKEIELREISEDDARRDFKDSLDKLFYRKNGDTDIALGLTEAMRMLVDSDSIGSNRNPLIILLSDGNTDLPRGPRSVSESEDELMITTQKLQDYGVPVYTIGLNADGSLDTQAMADISYATNAKSYETSSAGDLPYILSQIFADHIKVKELELDSFTGDGSSHQVLIPIPNDSIYEANIIILSSKPVKDLHLYVPGGVEVSIPSESVILNKSKCYTLVKIISPMAGDWLLELTGAQGDQITINLLRSYDFCLYIKADSDQIKKESELDVTVGFSNEDGVINDENVLIDAIGTLKILYSKTGEVIEKSLEHNGSTMTTSVYLSKVGDYQLSASIKGSNDSFYKESDIIKVKVVPENITLKTESLKTNFIIGLKNSHKYSLYDLVSWDESEGITVTTDYTDTPAICDVKVDYNDSILQIEAEKIGGTSFNLILKDGYEQTVLIPVAIRVLPLWPFIIGLLFVLFLTALIITILKLKNRPSLKGKLTISVNGTKNTPPEVVIEMAALNRRKGSIPLIEIVKEEPQYGYLISQALNEIGNLATGITITALDRECNRILVSIPASKNGYIILDGIQIPKNESKRAEMSRQSVFSIQYEYDNQFYEIILSFDQDSFGENDLLFDEIDPINDVPSSVENFSSEDGLLSMSPDGKDLF